jgi:hypothetical protein
MSRSLLAPDELAKQAADSSRCCWLGSWQGGCRASINQREAVEAQQCGRGWRLRAHDPVQQLSNSPSEKPGQRSCSSNQPHVQIQYTNRPAVPLELGDVASLCEAATIAFRYQVLPGTEDAAR